MIRCQTCGQALEPVKIYRISMGDCSRVTIYPCDECRVAWFNSGVRTLYRMEELPKQESGS